MNGIPQVNWNLNLTKLEVRPNAPLATAELSAKVSPSSWRGLPFLGDVTAGKPRFTRERKRKEIGVELGG